MIGLEEVEAEIKRLGERGGGTAAKCFEAFFTDSETTLRAIDRLMAGILRARMDGATDDELRGCLCATVKGLADTIAAIQIAMRTVRARSAILTRALLERQAQLEHARGSILDVLKAEASH